MTGWEITKGKRANGDTFEGDQVKVDTSAHAADLVVAAFTDSDGQSGGRIIAGDFVNAGGLGTGVFEADASPQEHKLPEGWFTDDHGVVNFGNVKFGVGEFEGKVAVVGEKD